MRRFVIGDIHGAYNALVQVLERCSFNYEQDLLITIGDIVDGWEDSFKCVEHLLTIPNRIDILGNHDNWFRTFLETGIHDQAWAMGGLSTAKSYAEGVGLDFKAQQLGRGWMVNLNTGDVPEDHQRFFKGQHKYYKDDDNNLFVHGGFNPNTPIGNQLAYILMWDRHLWSRHLAIRGGYMKKVKYVEDFNQIFIGHTSTTFCGSNEPVRVHKLTNMDTGAGGGGYLSIMDIDSREFWQSDYVPDLYPNDPHNFANV